MDDIIKYQEAVKIFNDVKSFAITLPLRTSYYQRLIPHIDDVANMTDKLIQLKEFQRKGIYKNEHATDILKLVVHLNQISNGVK
jgi:hypothetical protein